MKYNELSNFTYDEIKHFTWNDLSLDKYELIAKAENSSIKLPSDVQAKLYSLCSELEKSAPEKKSLFSKANLETVGDVAKIASSLVSTVKNLNDLGIGLILKQCFDAIKALF